METPRKEVIQTVNVVNALVAAAAINSVLAVPWTRVDEVYVTIVLLGTLVISVKNVQMDIMVIL
jgi:ABC-type branched-subunit amino acid transport system permease subunit